MKIPFLVWLDIRTYVLPRPRF